MRPDIDDLVVALVVGDEAHGVVVEHFLHLLVAFANIFLFFLGDNHIAQVEGKAALECHVVTEVLDVVEELCRTRNTAFLDNLGDDVAQRFL